MDLGMVAHLNTQILGRFAYTLLLIRKIPDFDLIHIFLPSRLGLPLMIVCKLLGVKYSIYMRGERLLNSALERWLLKNCEGVATVSSMLARRCGIADSKITTIRPMVELGRSDIVANNENVETERSIDLLFVGLIEEDKGVFDLIESVAILKKQGLELKCKIVLVLTIQA